MLLRKDYKYSTEGIFSEGCEFTLSEELCTRIKKAKELLLENKGVIDSVTLKYGVEIYTKQFDSTLDDDECKEIDEIHYFSHEDLITISAMTLNDKTWIRVTYKAIGKWDSSCYFEVDISEVLN
tara:strand:- start:2808 stop:3179 length:372 start_codon:yes stop_codon:yes gene_type:complete